MTAELCILGRGRRKSCIARVRIKKGNGKIVGNDKDLDSYFPVDRDKGIIRLPMKATKTLGEFDVLVNVKGGGITGQAGAISLGIALDMAESPYRTQ